MRVWPGSPCPLGAHWDGVGTQFAVYSRHATSVELCFFDGPGPEAKEERIPLNDRTHFVWHAYLPEVRPGSLYGFRVDGPWNPGAGHRFNDAKLLVDPYARALSGDLRWDDALFDGREGRPDPRDSAPFVPRGVVVDSSFPWGEDTRPDVPWDQTVIYECHVKGMTQLHPDVPEPLRGTYLGMASEPIVDHLLSLGVTTVELLPVHHAVSERGLCDRGLRNYWGYNTLGFFAPDARFARAAGGDQVFEFKSMVRALHRAGLEVILDVVYNHTAEGNHLGPTLSFRGIDNASYYHLEPGDPAHYTELTGCGNTLDVVSGPGFRLLMDSLRYWVNEMHVDGFRFDLASALAGPDRSREHLDRVFSSLRQDPALARAKLIVEPWDATGDGYRLGQFPPDLAEWNGSYRDCVRRFWRGDGGQLGEFASRVSGSADIFGKSDRSPLVSLNYVTAHDGFTLADLVSYERRHNEANGEHGADGEKANWSANWGVEGPSESETILRLRGRIVRSLLATLAFSQGVPMLSHGDELGRTQGGNNNAYAQDNETSWIDWQLDARARRLLEFTRRVFELRAAHPSLRRRHFFEGTPRRWRPQDVVWLRPDGKEFEDEDWNVSDARALGMLLPREASLELDDRGRRAAGGTLLVALNPTPRAIGFALPDVPAPEYWEHTLCTAGSRSTRLRRGAVQLAPHSLSLLTLRARA